MTDPTNTTPPVQVTVIGTGNGGTPLSTGTVATTPGNEPNLIVKVITPAAAIAIRFAHTYMTMLVGLVAAGMTTDQIPAHDFVALVLWSAKLSLAPAVLGLMKDTITLFARLEQKYPLATGNV